MELSLRLASCLKKSMPSLLMAPLDGATRTDRDDDKAHVGRDVTVLMAPRMSRDRKVSSQARAVSVVSGNVRWCSGIEGLDVNENKRVGPIIVMEDDVRCMRDGVALHPLVDCALTSVSATLRRDTRGAKGRVKERNEGLDSGIMARGMESHAVRALDEMPVARASESVAQGLGNGGAGGAAVVQRVMLPSPCVGGVRRRSRARGRLGSVGGFG